MHDENIAFLEFSDILKTDCHRDLSFLVNTRIDNIAAKAKLLSDEIEITELKKSMIAIKNSTKITIVTDKPIIQIKDAKYLFKGTKYTSIDLTNIDTSNLTAACNMFNKAAAKRINLSTMDTSNIMLMQSMFAEVDLDELDLSNFNTKNVRTMKAMFFKSTIIRLNISSFDTTYTDNLSQMFEGFTTHILDIRHFKTCKHTDASKMFKDLYANKLLMKPLNTSNYNGIFSGNIQIGNYKEIENVSTCI